MQAVILSFDSLAANCLGCYGNDWIETPHWDRLAATGAVFDQHFADVIGPLAGSSWIPATPINASAQTTNFVPLGRRLKAAGIQTRFVTAIEGNPWLQTADFEQTIQVSGHNGLDARPDEVPIAAAVKSGLSLLIQPEFQQMSRLLWLHCPGPQLPPRGFDSLYFEDFSERGVNIEELAGDERDRHPAVYAGAVSLFDHWLGELLAGIEATHKPTLVIVMAAQGHLWQHVHQATVNETKARRQKMCDQQIQAPLSLKFFNDERFAELACVRSRRLVQTCDLTSTLFDWFNLDRPDHDLHAGRSWIRELTEDVAARQTVSIHGLEQIEAVRTDAWLAIRDKSIQAASDPETQQEVAAVSLYVKPQDIWDVDDVASQYPDVISELFASPR